MTRTVFATFRSEQEAEQALSLVMREAQLIDSAVIADDRTGTLALEAMDLTAAEKAACHDQLKRGGFLMIAQAGDQEAGQAVLRVLQSPQNGFSPLIIAEAGSGSTDTKPGNIKNTSVEPTLPQSEAVIAEERIPIVQEELKIGKQEVVRGKAAIQSRVSEVPAREQVELSAEQFTVQNRPGGRHVSDEEVMRSGLLQDRVIEFSAMREEAIVSKEAVVREEVVISKHVVHRTEEIVDTVRRTEVEAERFEPEGTGSVR